MDGIFQCSRYAFGPNKLHHCGPDANDEIFEYIKNSQTDLGLKYLLELFETMYPYLKLIAHTNGITDIFDKQVVEAYWIGNKLLENAGQKHLYRHLLDESKIQNRYKSKTVEQLINKVREGALPHHSFHVLDVWRLGDKVQQNQNIEPLESCRISWGEIVAITGPIVTVKSPILVLLENKLTLSEPVKIKVKRSFEAELEIEQLKIGDLVSIHWGEICEKITPVMVENLRKYTLRHIHLANLTL